MTLQEINNFSQQQLREELLKCCGSSSWVKMMMAYFPVDNMEELLEHAEEMWYECSDDDWKEAFSHHPEIGDLDSLKKKFTSTAGWASGEQSGVQEANDETLQALAEGNRLYKARFGYIFIICATGKTAEEMLAALQERLLNQPQEEIKTAAAEQNKITRLRIRKLLE